MFADDLKLFESTKTIDDFRVLSDGLANIFKWNKDNDLLLNSGKYRTITLSRSKIVKLNIYYITRFYVKYITETRVSVWVNFSR